MHDIMAVNMFVQCSCVTRERTTIIYDTKSSRDREVLEGRDTDESLPPCFQPQV